MTMKNNRENDDKRMGIIIANDLRSGLTVFLTVAGEWTEQLSEAMVVVDEIGASDALSIAAKDEADNIVTGAYLTDSSESGEPIVLREALRVCGPSVDYQPGRSYSKCHPGLPSRSAACQVELAYSVSGEA